MTRAPIFGAAFAVTVGVAALAHGQTASDNSAAARAMTPSIGMPQTPGTRIPETNPGTTPVAPPSAGPSGGNGSAAANAGISNPYLGGGPGVSFGAAPPPVTSPAR